MSCPASSSSVFLFLASTGSLPATAGLMACVDGLTRRVSGQASRAWWPTTLSGAGSPSRKLATTLWLRLAYIVVFSLVAIEFITGLVLFSVVEGGPVLHFFVGWIPRFIDIQWIRVRAFPGHVYFRWVSSSITSTAPCWWDRRKERRNGKHLHWLEICSPAPHR